ncbi:uncharacterized protein J8A68_006087 [[Candida] subhashii]|uniref:BOD1/SHG1 domain-containing protein n=1 Tax=[Candida] subhashii TaxID=561895 RepID=A0A8J5Q0F1_9ASCO|nr:uncharacterized protein J8A68_006087 [[Candida] subhashii]KAG7660404.1 hypothetical protein J8A68_006087 [[Candida] subhashii]
MVESKVKQDPKILLKNRGKMAALIQGEIINTSTPKTDEKNGESGGRGGESGKSSSSADSLLGIVDKDIQDKIIDSPEFHGLIRDELCDIRRKLMGISDEEWDKQKEQERLRLERLKMEAKLKSLKEKDYKSSFRIKNLSGSHGGTSGSGSSSSGSHRVTKPPRFNIGHKSEDSSHTGNSSSDKKESTKKDKIQFMMY